MSHRIIKQPNGKYCIYSTIVDDIIFYNATPNDIKAYYLEIENVRINNDVDNAINKPDEYYYGGWSFNDYETMMERIKILHKGEKEILKKLQKNIKEMEE
jgi:hypothetical protein